MPKGQACE